LNAQLVILDEFLADRRAY